MAANITTKLAVLILMSSIHIQSQATSIHSDADHSTEKLGAYEAKVTWNGNALIVALTNTSHVENGGYLTGFLLDLPKNVSFGSATSNSRMTALLPGGGPYSASPFGSYDYGFALGADFLGGGSPKNGIGIGQTQTFTFSDWRGIPSTLQTPEQIERYLLDNVTSAAIGDVQFLARFKGFNNGGSDKVPGMFDEITLPPPPPPPPVVIVPEPATIFLMFFGVVGLLLRRKSSHGRGRFIP